MKGGKNEKGGRHTEIEEPWKAAAPEEDAKTVGGLEKGQWRMEEDERRIKEEDKGIRNEGASLN